MIKEKIQELQRITSIKRADLDKQKATQEVLIRNLSDNSSQIQDLRSDIEVYDRVTVLLNSIGEDRQKQAQEKIEGIVTKGIQSIFGDDYSFHISQTMKGKNASVEFTVRTMMDESVLETSVLDSHGGGLAAVIGFLLRVTVMLLDKNDKTKLIVGDEVFAAVSREYLDPLASFVKELVEKTGMQFILITHSPEWSDYADVTYRFGNKKGVTYVKQD